MADYVSASGARLCLETSLFLAGQHSQRAGLAEGSLGASFPPLLHQGNT